MVLAVRIVAFGAPLGWPGSPTVCDIICMQKCVGIQAVGMQSVGQLPFHK